MRKGVQIKMNIGTGLLIAVAVNGYVRLGYECSEAFVMLELTFQLGLTK